MNHGTVFTPITIVLEERHGRVHSWVWPRRETSGCHGPFCWLQQLDLGEVASTWLGFVEATLALTSLGSWLRVPFRSWSV